jgi:hypothetical protein
VDDTHILGHQTSPVATPPSKLVVKRLTAPLPEKFDVVVKILEKYRFGKYTRIIMTEIHKNIVNLPKTTNKGLTSSSLLISEVATLEHKPEKFDQPYQLYYHKSKMIDLKEIPYPYSHLSSKESLADSIQKPQMYLPIYQRFFELNDHNYQSISLNHQHHIKNLQEVTTLTHSSIQPANVFIKFSPLLDPIKYMVGKYDLDDPATKNLPTIHSTESDTNPKILSTSNASYIDGFFYYLTSVLRNQHNFVHGIDFYGSYLGIQDNFKVNIEEDLEYLSKSPFFIKNIGKLMILENYNQENSPFSHAGSRGYHPTVSIDHTDCCEQIDIGIIDIDTSHELEISALNSSGSPLPLSEKEPVVDVTPLLENEDDEEITPLDANDESEDDSDDSKSENSSEDILSDKENQEGCGDDDEADWETEDETDDEGGNDSPEAVAYIHDFPVQLIFLEKCHGTMDELFMNNMNVEESRSALFQIIMILLVYQKLFKFTHNDLHTNNIMYVNTDLVYLKYKYRNQYYCVPTYGRIFKIIDYGRSIYKYSKLCFCSDSFAPGGDASTQYNCEPFMKSSKPRLNPNMSFDLCRLGCSIFDFLFDDDDLVRGAESLPTTNSIGHLGDRRSLDTVVDNDLKRTIQRWCTDDDGKNILYKRNGSERYPGFKLYKMIARTVHQHTPEQQLTDPWFSIFNENDTKHNEYMHALTSSNITVSDISHIMDIDSYPEYA